MIAEIYASSTSCRSAASTDHPSKSGIMTSSVIASGRKSLASFNPSNPPAAVTTEKPASLRLSAIRSRAMASSSMTSTPTGYRWLTAS